MMYNIPVDPNMNAFKSKVFLLNSSPRGAVCQLFNPCDCVRWVNQTVPFGFYKLIDKNYE